MANQSPQAVTIGSLLVYKSIAKKTFTIIKTVVCLLFIKWIGGLIIVELQVFAVG